MRVLLTLSGQYSSQMQESIGLEVLDDVFEALSIEDVEPLITLIGDISVVFEVNAKNVFCAVDAFHSMEEFVAKTAAGTSNKDLFDGT